LTTWEYHTVLFIDPKKLTELGHQGWELCCAVGKDANRLIFKRPVSSKTAVADKKQTDYTKFD